MPCLKWKAGEQRALRDVEGAEKDRLLPLVEIPPLPWDWANDQAAKTVDQHLSRVAEQLETYWGPTAPILVDTLLLDPSERMHGGNVPLEWLFDEFAARSLTTIPCIGVSSDPALQVACKGILARDQRGVGLRLDRDSLFDGSTTLVADINAVLSAIGATPAETELIVDVEAVDSLSWSSTAVAVVATWQTIPHQGSWRSVTLLSGGFPDSMSRFSPGVSRDPRSDWQLYNRVASRVEGTVRFGDYGIAHPELAEIDPRIMQMSASIRYSGATDWVIVKGRSVRKHGWQQTRVLATQMVAQPEYCGPTFSAGDKYTDDVANGADGPGNATSWRQAGTNHHLALVVHQLAGKPLTATPGVP
jgi:hypothetical protein